MIKFGLSGGIATGKSTVANTLKEVDIPVHDSDKTVHSLMKKGRAGYEKIKIAFPEAAQTDDIDRKVLSRLVTEDISNLRILEKILHPLVTKDRNEFTHYWRKKRANVIVYDVPLLFEVGLYKICDQIILTDCPIWLQKQRIMARKDMSQKKMQLLLARQMSVRRKKLYADYIINTALPARYNENLIKTIFKNYR